MNTVRIHRVLGIMFALFFISSYTPPAAAVEEPKPETILLWPDGAPLAQGTADADIPRLTIYLPKKSFCQTAVVVVPGGSLQDAGRGP